MNLIEAALSVLRVGQVVANPTAWKKGQVHANQIAALLVAALYIAKTLGVDIHMDDETMAAVAVGIVALVNWVFTVVSTDKIGVTGRVPTDPAAAAPRDEDLRGGP